MTFTSLYEARISTTIMQMAIPARLAEFPAKVFETNHV